MHGKKIRFFGLKLTKLEIFQNPIIYRDSICNLAKLAMWVQPIGRDFFGAFPRGKKNLSTGLFIKVNTSI